MALTTITFDTLRERNNTLLADAGIHQSQTDLTTAQMRRLATHLPARAEIEALASTASQREAYGLNKWNQDFIRLRDIDSSPDAGVTKEQLRQALWDALPNSRFKRFQELFSHPHQLIVPRSMLSESGQIARPPVATLNTCSLAGVLVSADLIDDNFATTIGLVTFTTEDLRRPAQRLQRKADLTVLNDLKALFEVSHPIDERRRDHRVLLVDDATRPIHGSFLYTRQTGNKSDSIPATNGQVAMRRLSIQFFSGAYEVFRKTRHTQSGYHIETGSLSEMQNDLQQLVRVLDRDWRRTAPDETKEILRQRAIQIIGRHHQTLETCPNEYKQAATELLASSAELRDSLGRTNPGASMAKLSKAARTILKRMEEIRPKGRFNTQDSMLISSPIAANEALFRRFRVALEENSSVLRSDAIRGIALFSERPLSPAQIASNSAGLLVRLGVHPDDFNGVHMQPFLPFARSIQRTLTDFTRALSERDSEQAQRALVKSYLHWKFYAVHIAFEHTKEKIADSSNVPLQEVRNFVDVLTDTFRSVRILPSVVIGSYEKPLMEMDARLNGIRNRLNEYAAREITPTEQTRIYRDFKKYLETFDIPKIVTALE